MGFSGSTSYAASASVGKGSVVNRLKGIGSIPSFSVFPELPLPAPAGGI